MSNVEIGWAKPDEWSEIMTMVWKTFLAFEGKIYSPSGIKEFFDFITNDRLYQGFLRGNYQVMAAREGEKIVGMGSIRNGNFLSLLFVDEQYQRRQIGTRLMRELIHYLKTETGESVMIVKSAPGAEDFYRKLGFEVTGGTEDLNGVLVLPMRLLL